MLSNPQAYEISAIGISVNNSIFAEICIRFLFIYAFILRPYFSLNTVSVLRFEPCALRNV